MLGTIVDAGTECNTMSGSAQKDRKKNKMIQGIQKKNHVETVYYNHISHILRKRFIRTW